MHSLLLQALVQLTIVKDDSIVGMLRPIKTHDTIVFSPVCTVSTNSSHKILYIIVSLTSDCNTNDCPHYIVHQHFDLRSTLATHAARKLV